MGSKNNPGAFDCFAAAEPDEPIACSIAMEKWAKEHGKDPKQAHDAMVKVLKRMKEEDVP